MLNRAEICMLGGRFRFESNSAQLLRLVDSAYADLPRHRLPGRAPIFKVRLLALGYPPRGRGGPQPPPFRMLSGPGSLGAATQTSDFVVMSPDAQSALVAVSNRMLSHPYHTRYELIEFAVFTLASRRRKLISLHAACIGRAGRGILLMGASGAGKSTVTLLSIMQGFDMLSEDSVFTTSDTLLATGIANFLHVRSDSLRWAGRDAAMIRRSPVIRRRSGVRKFEVDLRRTEYRLAPSPLKIAAVVFLSARSAGDRPRLDSLTKSALLAKLSAAQAYAANQPGWSTFAKNLSRLDAFELKRGRHPMQTVDALAELLGGPPRSRPTPE